MVLDLDSARVEKWEKRANDCTAEELPQLLEDFRTAEYPPREVIAEAITPTLFARFVAHDLPADMVGQVFEEVAPHLEDKL